MDKQPTNKSRRRRRMKTVCILAGVGLGILLVYPVLECWLSLRPLVWKDQEAGIKFVLEIKHLDWLEPKGHFIVERHTWWGGRKKQVLVINGKYSPSEPQFVRYKNWLLFREYGRVLAGYNYSSGQLFQGDDKSQFPFDAWDGSGTIVATDE